MPFVVGCALILPWAARPNEPSVKVQPYGIAKRVAWTTSRVVGSPEPLPPFQSRPAFPKLKFNHPLHLLSEPDSERLFVVEQSGKIHAFPNDSASAKTDLVCAIKDHETYSLTFHPNYAKNRYVYVFSNGPQSGKKRYNRIYRFEVKADPPGHFDDDSKTLIIEWESNGHNGGDLAFGPDGFLYLTSGDGTSDSDGWLTGQKISDLASGVLRIDVDRPEPGKSYAVPKDNPFLKLKDARPELWAYGFRNPWRMSFDPKTGNLWVGDIGQDLWEMIHLIQRGGNYGWSVFEGSQPFQLNRQRGPHPILKPVIEHHHSEARSITGGFVYYGARYKDLQGAYLYGDYSTGRIWGMRYAGGKVTWHKELAHTTLQILGLGRDQKGEPYIVDYAGQIHELEPRPPEVVTTPFPRKLSESGVFASVAEHKPMPGLIPYSVVAPLWSDHSHKERFLGLPGESKIDFTEKGAWKLPEGTVLVKTFLLDMEAGNPASRRRIETRFLTLQRDEWRGYSYRWNDEQTDAELVSASGQDHELVIKDANSPGGKRKQVWHYPSRAECMVCHSRAAGFVLGLTTLQMNKVHDYGAVADNQLRTLEHIGIFKQKKLPKARATLAHLSDPYDARADLDARARSYLHANCAQCHTGAGGGNSAMELTFATPLEKTKLIDVTPQHDHYGIKDAKLIAPGDPQRSVLLERMKRHGNGRMPPLSVSLTDEPAAQLIAAWIKQVKPEDATPVKKDLKAFHDYLDKSYPKKKWQVRPTQLDSAGLREAYPNRRFYYVFSSPPLPPGAANKELIEAYHNKMKEFQEHYIALAVSIDDKRTITRLGKPETYNEGLMRIKTDDDARTAAAAILSLHIASRAGPRVVEAKLVTVKKNDKGWTCSVQIRNVVQGTVVFDAKGKCTSVSKSSLMPLPP
jgi:uncharacterized repeat protein (TIGR03806 family)